MRAIEQIRKAIAGDAPQARTTAVTSDQIVEDLQQFGSVSVFQLDSGFHAVCQLRLAGISAEVRGSFRQKSMRDALVDLQQKVYAACHR